MKLLFAFLLLPFVIWGQTAGGTVSGEVHSAASRMPLEGVQVSLTGAASADGETDERGAFRFEGLPDGDYTLSVQKEGFSGAGKIRVGVRGSTPAEPVAVVLYPFARIEGRVLDEDGAPVAGVIVSAAVPSQPNALNMRPPATEKDGRFELANLPPAAFAIVLRIPSELREKGYPAVQLYPGLVQVAEGMRMTGFDIKMRRTPLLTLRGRIIDLEKDEAARVVEVAVDCHPAVVDGAFIRYPVDANGRFHIEGVPVGSHRLMAYRGTGTGELPYSTMVVTGEDEVTVPVPAFSDLAGMVRSADMPWEGVFGIGLGGDGAWRHDVVPDEEGRFTLSKVPPGKWSLRLESNGLAVKGKALRIAHARFGSEDVFGKPVTVTESGNPSIDIELTTESGRIAGTVDEEAAKQAQTFVVAQRTDGSPVTADNFAEIKRDGSFLISDLLPGEYQVMAWGVTPSRQSAMGTDCSKRAEKVSVVNGATAVVQLKRCDQ